MLIEPIPNVIIIADSMNNSSNNSLENLIGSTDNNLRKIFIST